MKTLKMTLLVITISLLSTQLDAQFYFGFNFGIPFVPRYHYHSDIGVYFDLQTSMYIYPSGSRWIHARDLPQSYGHYDRLNGSSVIINNYWGDRPFYYYKEHRQKYPKNRNSHQGGQYIPTRVNNYNDKPRYDFDSDKRGNDKRNYQDNGKKGNNNGNKGKGNGGNKGNGSGNKGKGNGGHGKGK